MPGKTGKRETLTTIGGKRARGSDERSPRRLRVLAPGLRQSIPTVEFLLVARPLGSWFRPGAFFFGRLAGRRAGSFLGTRPRRFLLGYSTAPNVDKDGALQ
jgi:hypothetical protein